MTRFADPGRCPDCAAAIVPGAAACASCGLSLRGDDAARLFSTLSQADELLGRLRAQGSSIKESRAAPDPTPAAGPTTQPLGPATQPPGPSRPPPGPPGPDRDSLIGGRRGMPAASVPRILLGLGAGCLLVAALVFLAVTWSVLGVGGRTAVLLGLTAVAAGLAAEMSRRRLRAAAESLALVGYGLLTLDLIGANHAGWFGSLSAMQFLSLLGAVLIATGAGVTLAARRHHRELAAGEVAAAGGVFLLALGVAVTGDRTGAASTLIATLLAVAATVVADRLRLKLAAAGSAGVAVLGWLVLTGWAEQRLLDHGLSWSALWGGFRVWPVLAAAGLAALPAAIRRFRTPLRVGGPAVATLLVTLAALFPAAQLSGTPITLVLLGVLIGCSVAMALLPRPWAAVPGLTQLVAAAGVLVVTAALAGDAIDRLVHAADPALSGAATDRLPEYFGPAPWLLPACVVGLLVTAWSFARASGRRIDPLDLPPAAPTALVAAAVVLALSLYPVPVVLVVAATLLVTVGFLGAWVTRGDGVTLAAGAFFAAAGLAVSRPAEPLLLAALAVLLAAAAIVHLRAGPAVAGVAGAVLAASAAGVGGTVADLAGAPAPWVALVALVVLGLLVLAGPLAPDAWWRAPADDARVGLEAGALLAAAVAAGTGATHADHVETWVAVYLTVAGVVVTLIALLRPDRRALTWAGGGLLAAASWVRLADLGVRAPEAYTLPSAVVLVAAGLVRLRRTPSTGTTRALQPGLLLALVPSLLWVLADPGDGRRALLLGLGCLVLVLTGARLGWTAPLVTGAVVGALEVLRLAGPYLGNAIPRWVLIGLAGALLLGLGATWEHRLRDARRVYAYLGGLS